MAAPFTARTRPNTQVWETVHQWGSNSATINRDFGPPGPSGRPVSYNRLTTNNVPSKPKYNVRGTMGILTLPVRAPPKIVRLSSKDPKPIGWRQPAPPSRGESMNPMTDKPFYTEMVRQSLQAADYERAIQQQYNVAFEQAQSSDTTIAEAGNRRLTELSEENARRYAAASRGIGGVANPAAGAYLDAYDQAVRPRARLFAEPDDQAPFPALSVGNVPALSVGNRSNYSRRNSIGSARDLLSKQLAFKALVNSDPGRNPMFGQARLREDALQAIATARGDEAPVPAAEPGDPDAADPDDSDSGGPAARLRLAADSDNDDEEEVKRDEIARLNQAQKKHVIDEYNRVYEPAPAAATPVGIYPVAHVGPPVPPDIIPAINRDTADRVRQAAAPKVDPQLVSALKQQLDTLKVQHNINLKTSTPEANDLAKKAYAAARADHKSVKDAKRISKQTRDLFMESKFPEYNQQVVNLEQGIRDATLAASTAPGVTPLTAENRATLSSINKAERTQKGKTDNALRAYEKMKYQEYRLAGRNHDTAQMLSKADRKRYKEETELRNNNGIFSAAFDSAINHGQTPEVAGKFAENEERRERKEQEAQFEGLFLHESNELSDIVQETTNLYRTLEPWNARRGQPGAESYIDELADIKTRMDEARLEVDAWARTSRGRKTSRRLLNRYMYMYKEMSKMRPPPPMAAGLPLQVAPQVQPPSGGPPGSASGPQGPGQPATQPGGPPAQGPPQASQPQPPAPAAPGTSSVHGQAPTSATSGSVLLPVGNMSMPPPPDPQTSTSTASSAQGGPAQQTGVVAPRKRSKTGSKPNSAATSPSSQPSTPTSKPSTPRRRTLSSASQGAATSPTLQPIAAPAAGPDPTTRHVDVHAGLSSRHEPTGDVPAAVAKALAVEWKNTNTGITHAIARAPALDKRGMFNEVDVEDLRHGIVDRLRRIMLENAGRGEYDYVKLLNRADEELSRYLANTDPSTYFRGDLSDPSKFRPLLDEVHSVISETLTSRARELTAQQSRLAPTLRTPTTTRKSESRLRDTPVDARKLAFGDEVKEPAPEPAQLAPGGTVYDLAPLDTAMDVEEFDIQRPPRDVALGVIQGDNDPDSYWGLLSRLHQAGPKTSRDVNAVFRKTDWDQSNQSDSLVARAKAEKAVTKELCVRYELMHGTKKKVNVNFVRRLLDVNFGVANQILDGEMKLNPGISRFDNLLGYIYYGVQQFKPRAASRSGSRANSRGTSRKNSDEKDDATTNAAKPSASATPDEAGDGNQVPIPSRGEPNVSDTLSPAHTRSKKLYKQQSVVGPHRRTNKPPLASGKKKYKPAWGYGLPPDTDNAMDTTLGANAGNEEPEPKRPYLPSKEVLAILGTQDLPIYDRQENKALNLQDSNMFTRTSYCPNQQKVGSLTVKRKVALGIVSDPDTRFNAKRKVRPPLGWSGIDDGPASKMARRF